MAIFKLILTDGNYEPSRKNFPFIWSKNGGNRLVSPSFGQKTMSPKKVVRRPVKVPLRRGCSSFPRLQSLVFGAWNEASPDVHNLVHTVAAARLRREQELQDDGPVARRRRMSPEGALAILTGQVRRTLSLVAARAQARLLLDRLQVFLEGSSRGQQEEKVARS